MAWTDPTDGAKDSVMKQCYFELFTALNERETLVGVTPTQFYVANGTYKSNTVLADFAGMSVTAMHEDGSTPYGNLYRLRDGIAYLISITHSSIAASFAVPGNYTDFESAFFEYTGAGKNPTMLLLSLGSYYQPGYSDWYFERLLSTDDDLVEDKNVILNFQEGFDSLTKLRWLLGMDLTSDPTHYRINADFFPSDPFGYEVCWDDVLSESPSNEIFGRYAWYVSRTYDPGEGYSMDAQLTKKQNNPIAVTSSVVGALEKGIITTRKWTNLFVGGGGTGFTYDGSLSLTVEGVTVTPPTSTYNMVEISWVFDDNDVGTSWPDNIGGMSTLTAIEATRPTDAPINPPSPDTASFSLEVGVQIMNGEFWYNSGSKYRIGTRCYTDISGLLTYG